MHFLFQTRSCSEQAPELEQNRPVQIMAIPGHTSLSEMVEYTETQLKLCMHAGMHEPWSTMDIGCGLDVIC